MRDNSRQTNRLRTPSILHGIVTMLAMLFGMVCRTSAQPLPAPSERWLSIGAAAGYGRSLELGEVTLPETVGCDTLTSGHARPIRLSVLAELPMAPRLFYHARLGAIFEPGELRVRSQYPPVFPAADGRPLTGAFDQVLTFDRVRLSALLGVRMAATQQLSILGGVELTRELSTDQTAQQEAISPSSFLFANRRRVYELRSGELVAPSALAVGLAVGAGYELPIGARSVLTPEVLLSVPVTSLASSSAWRSIAATVGLSVRFPLVRLDRPPVVVIDTPRIQPTPRLEAAVMTRPTIVSVRIDEFDSTEALPLLNQVFFEEGSARVPARYQLLDSAGVSRFTNDSLTGTALDVYYHLLNIVAARMRRTPAATLTIAAYRNGRERDPEVSRARAEAIREYLTDTWGIPRRRLKVTGGAAPPSPALETSEEGLQENSRAELLPSDPNITAPVIRSHVLRVATPPSVVFFPQVVAEAGVATWRLDVLQEDRAWRSFDGVGTPPDSITWDWRSDSSGLPTVPMRLSYQLTVTDRTGQQATTSEHEIEVRYESLQQRLENRQNDTLIESYSLLLFNYDSPRVSPQDEVLLRAYAELIRPGAFVRITGYTDSLGLESHNRDLANRRATETARLIRSIAPSDISVVVSDDGGERERFPYGTPEGRSHCRTVVIEVRTPAKPKQ